MKKKTQHIIPGSILFILFFLLLAVSFTVTAQESQSSEDDATYQIDYNSMGDQVFSINAGLFIPLFMQDPTPKGGEDAIFINQSILRRNRFALLRSLPEQQHSAGDGNRRHVCQESQRQQLLYGADNIPGYL